jgi:TonB family protein
MKVKWFLFLLAVVALPQPSRSQSLADRWMTGLKAVDQQLRAQDWAAAERQAGQLAAAIADSAGTSEDAAYSLAVASVFRAIAAAELGRQDEAAWSWDTALNLDPSVAKTNLSPYGPAAAELRKRTLRPVETELNPEYMRLVDETGKVEFVKTDEEGQGKVRRPRVSRQVSPRYPQGLRGLRKEGWVAVSSIIDTDGRLRNPLVIKTQGGGPAMKYAALEALRAWRFEPATRDGKPVKVQYVLTINFKESKKVR